MFANFAKGGATQAQLPASVAPSTPHANATEVAANGGEILSSAFTLQIFANVSRTYQSMF